MFPSPRERIGEAPSSLQSSRHPSPRERERGWGFIFAFMYIHGKLTDSSSRCTHYNSPLDIIAIKFKCCNTYYACIHCHEELSSHQPQVWTKNEWENKAILCGNCKHELTINEYFDYNYTCPSCSSQFNPKCSNHNHFYFEVNND